MSLISLHLLAEPCRRYSMDVLRFSRTWGSPEWGFPSPYYSKQTCLGFSRWVSFSS